MKVPLLWLCGPSGVGKSTVGWEIFGRSDSGAFVDLDQLGLCYPSPADDPYNHRTKARNLGAIWPHLRSAGAGCVVLAGGIEVAEQIGLYAGSVPDAELTVCRLRADHATLRERFLRRGWMPELADEAVADVDKLDRLDLGDLCVETGGLSVAEVARMIGERADGWPKTAAPPPPSPPRSASALASAEPVPVLLLNGATAVGKSTVGYQVFTQLRAVAKAAYVHLAQVGFCRPAPADDPEHHRLKAANLAAMWPAFRDIGARCLVVTGRVNDAASLRTYIEAFPAMDLTVYRLEAGEETLTERILHRGRGGGPAIPGDDLRGRTPEQLRLVAARAAREAGKLRAEQLGDVPVETNNRSVDDLARLIAADFLRRHF